MQKKPNNNNTNTNMAINVQRLIFPQSRGGGLFAYTAEGLSLKIKFVFSSVFEESSNSPVTISELNCLSGLLSVLPKTIGSSASYYCSILAYYRSYQYTSKYKKQRKK